VRKQGHLCDEGQCDGQHKVAVAPRLGVFAIKSHTREEQRKMVKERNFHENLFQPAELIYVKSGCQKGNTQSATDVECLSQFSKEENESHQNIEEHFHIHRPVRAFQIGNIHVILKHSQVSREGQPRIFQRIFLCVVEMDGNNTKGKEHTHPISRIQPCKAIYDESTQAVGLLKAHENNKATYHKEQVYSRGSESEDVLISSMSEAKMKKNYSQSGNATQGIEWLQSKVVFTRCVHEAQVAKLHLWLSAITFAA